jgi:predicted nicotinamide N-methyase
MGDDIFDNKEAQVIYSRLSKNYCLSENPFDLEIDGVVYPFRIYSVKSIDDLLERVIDEESIPFWAEIWDSAFALSQYCVKKIINMSCISEPYLPSVLELGCGVGLVGVCVSHFGASVTQVDYSPDAIQFCRLNAYINGVHNIRQISADIRQLNLHRHYDLIIGSDILYEPNLHPYLLKTLELHLNNNGVAIFADPGRNWASKFIDLASQLGWTYDIDEVLINRDNESKTIDIITLARREGN